MSRNKLADQLDLLFEYGDSRGISSAYRTIAVATGENATNIRKIHLGHNLNPGLRILTALVNYFDVDLDYFDCSSSSACAEYLKTIRQRKLMEDLVRLADGISEEGRTFLFKAIDYIRRAEGLAPIGKRD